MSQLEALSHMTRPTSLHQFDGVLARILEQRDHMEENPFVDVINDIKALYPALHHQIIATYRQIKTPSDKSLAMTDIKTSPENMYYYYALSTYQAMKQMDILPASQQSNWFSFRPTTITYYDAFAIADIRRSSLPKQLHADPTTLFNHGFAGPKLNSLAVDCILTDPNWCSYLQIQARQPFTTDTLSRLPHPHILVRGISDVLMPMISNKWLVSDIEDC